MVDIWLDAVTPKDSLLVSSLLPPLHKKGYETIVTAKRQTQTTDVLELLNIPYTCVGKYGETLREKLATEQYCKVFNRSFGLKTVCLRFFNVYGPRHKGPYSAVITCFVDRLRENESPIICGDGEQTRDFLYVEDVVEACMLSLSSENCVSEIINVGTGTKTTITGLANLLRKLMKKNRIKPIYTAPRKEDIRHSFADIGKAQRILGYNPRVTLEKGLEGLLNEDK